jgi:hypothetical protein
VETVNQAWHFLGSFVGGYLPPVFLITEVAQLIKHWHHQVILLPDDHVFEVLCLIQNEKVHPIWFTWMS